MFITVLWKAGKMGTPPPPAITSFISSFGKKLAARDPNTGTLGRDVLNALTALEALAPGSLGRDKEMDCARIWLASLDSDPENLLDACVYIRLGPTNWLTCLDLSFSCIRQLCSCVFWLSKTRRFA